jgi:hypothetical protein
MVAFWDGDLGIDLVMMGHSVGFGKRVGMHWEVLSIFWSCGE